MKKPWQWGWADPFEQSLCAVWGVAIVLADGDTKEKVRANKEEHARLIAAAPELYEATLMLLARDERNTCQHEETHRGGTIWEICDSCGAKWADDEGGKPTWEDPPEWIAARAALAKARGES